MTSKMLKAQYLENSWRMLFSSSRYTRYAVWQYVRLF